MAPEKISQPPEYWFESFGTAHVNSWPTQTTSIAHDIFVRDEELIMVAAKKYGYEIYHRTRKVVAFMRGQ